MVAPKAFARVLVVAFLAAASAMLSACSNPFAPSTTRPPGGDPPQAQKATTPEIAMDNLARAFNERDKELYETVLDPDFWFTETDCRGELVLANGFEEELEIMGTREGGSHGIHGLEIIFYWRGKKGVIQFVLSTGWTPYYSKVSKIGTREEPNYDNKYYLMPSDLGYHSLKPMYKDQTPMTGKCSVLGNKTCYYDGSGLNSHDAFYVLVNAGEEELWKFLEQYYLCVFEKGKYPKVKEYPCKMRIKK